MHRARAIAIMLLAAAVVSCDSSSTGPETRNESELTFVRPAPDAPPLSTISKAMLFTKGQGGELRLYYRPRPAETDSTDFIRLKLENETLLRLPDGSTILDGQQVLITVTAVNIGSRLEVRFDPAGLVFDPNKPAELKIDFKEADHDYDEDGDEDSEDDQIQSILGIWRTETGSTLWTRLTSNVRVDEDKVEADLKGFSNYALAF